jgi:hypothetical protein
MHYPPGVQLDQGALAFRLERLHVTIADIEGADEEERAKRQIARFGSSVAGMPPLLASRGKDREFVISYGVTRPTRSCC